MTFPQRRLRRLRRTPALRRLVAETRLGVDDLIAPLFVREGIDRPEPIPSLPGVMQHTLGSLRREVAELRDLGVGAVILFVLELNLASHGLLGLAGVVAFTVGASKGTCPVSAW